MQVYTPAISKHISSKRSFYSRLRLFSCFDTRFTDVLL